MIQYQTPRSIGSRMSPGRLPSGQPEVLVVREEGGALELRVEAPQPELAREQGPLTRGVHDDLRADLLRGPADRPARARRPPGRPRTGRPRRPSPRAPRRRSRRRAEQQVVELGALDVVRHGVAGNAGLGEDDRPRRAVAPRSRRTRRTSSGSRRRGSCRERRAGRRSAASTAGSDSPTWKRGNFSRSSTRTLPARARQQPSRRSSLPARRRSRPRRMNAAMIGF